MVEIVQDPQLRYTADNQIPIAEMLVKFPNLRDDTFAVLKVVGWGSLAQEINEKYHQGDHVIVEGRLGMNTIDRPEGFKEKRAELTAQKIYILDLGASNSSSNDNEGMSEMVSAPSNVVQLSSRNRNSSAPANSSGSEPMQPTPSQMEESEPDFEPPSDPENPDYDPIPF